MTLSIGFDIVGLLRVEECNRHLDSFIPLEVTLLLLLKGIIAGLLVVGID